MSNVRKGTNYEVDDSQINFFGVKGEINGSQWIANTLGGSTFTPIERGSILPKIRDCIQGDVAKGKGNEIATVQLAPRQGVVFFLEGMLTRKHFDAAKEGADYVDIPNVEVEGRTLTVRIKKDAKFTVATLDAKGNVI